MNLVESNDPILTTECEPFDFRNPQFDPVDFAHQIVKFMYDNNGIGISANQVGIRSRVFAMRSSPQNFVCFNPKVVQPSEQMVVLEESSLTHPGLIVKVKRPQHVRVRFTTPNGETKTETFTGMTARVFQQMVDNLDGVLYFNRASRYHRDIALEKWRKGNHSTIQVKPKDGLNKYEYLLHR
jgi:peptide deformylase